MASVLPMPFALLDNVDRFVPRLGHEELAAIKAESGQVIQRRSF